MPEASGDPEELISELHLGTGLKTEEEHRIFEDVHQLLGGTGLSRRPFKIYKRGSGWFEISIDVTLNGKGKHMIYLCSICYKMPEIIDPNALHIWKELDQKIVSAQLFNMVGHTESLDEEKIRAIGETFGLKIDNLGKISINEIDVTTRKKVGELLAQ